MDAQSPGTHLHVKTTNINLYACFVHQINDTSCFCLSSMRLIENQTFRLFVSVELNSRDPSYGWFLNWMARNVKHTQHLSVSTDLIKHDNGTVTTSFGFLPSTGDSYFYQLILFG